MVKVFDTANLDEALMKTLSNDEAANIYNGLDCCVTSEVYSTLSAQLESNPPNVRETYEMAMNKLAPIMEMSLRGTLIDEASKQETIKSLEKDLAVLDRRFQKIMVEVFDGELNWRSPIQLRNLFYGAMRLKEIKSRGANGVYRATTNRDALEKLRMYLYARPLVNFILLMRDVHKQLSFLRTEIDKDNRIRCNYNLAGTNTGRLASSMSDFGTGTNLQNVNRKLRFPFVADPGMYLVNIDLEQADGRNVGAICWDTFVDMPREEIARLMDLREWNGPVGEELAGAYLDACESGDLHTTVCNMTWPELDWPEDPDGWKKYCDSVILTGQDSYRQSAKKLGHGTNYYGTPRTMAVHAHTPTAVIQNFQSRYFRQFPAIKLWHAWTIDQIKTLGMLTTLFGRRRMFFGRTTDASTHRKAIAFSPQSMTGEQIDRGMHQVWERYSQVQLLNQVHDSILLQVPFSEKDELIPLVLKHMEVALTLKRGRRFVVPLDAAGGWNWGYADLKKNRNPYGLVKWTGREERDRPKPCRRLSDYLKKPAQIGSKAF